MYRNINLALTLAVFLTVALLALPQPARAHCDTMDGPVVIEAQTALDKRDITPLLKWVKTEHEAELRQAFDEAVAIRGQGGTVKEVADHHFLETLVRVHRDGEGAPYTGLKPAGMQEPVVIAADKALEKGSAEELERQIIEAVKEGLHKRFEHAAETQRHAAHNVDAGREFIAAYVEYMHYVERLHMDAVTAAVHQSGGAGHEQHGAAPAAGGGCGHHE